MRDDSGVSAFRLHSLWLKLFVILLVALTLLCVFGVYGTFYYKHRHHAEKQERHDSQEELKETKIQLERLQNIDELRLKSIELELSELKQDLRGNETQLQRLLNLEKLIQASGMEHGSSFSSVVQPSVPAVGTEHGEGSLSAAAAPSPEYLKELLDQNAGGNASRTVSAPTSAGSSASADASGGTLPAAGRQTPPSGASSTATRQTQTSETPAHPIKVSNLQSTFQGSDRIRISFDLSNQDSRLTLVGRCNLLVITAKGVVLPIQPTSRGIMTFQIARYRKMESVFTLPAGITVDDVVQIQVNAQANDLPPYQVHFPFAR